MSQRGTRVAKMKVQHFTRVPLRKSANPTLYLTPVGFPVFFVASQKPGAVVTEKRL